MTTVRPEDGRRARGEARKLQIVEATLAMLSENGAGAVTHRAVAKRAGIPVASVTYHFRSIEDVIERTLEYANQRFVDELASGDWGTGVAGLANFVEQQTQSRRDLLIAEYELYMVALRRTEPSPSVLAWLDAVTDHFVPQLPAARRRTLHVLIEGACLHSALQPGIYSVAELDRLFSIA